MTEQDDPERTTANKAPSDPQVPSYIPPTLTVLGTLAELTGGGSLAPTDGFGGAGTTGSV
jgi:hypothetical protein